MEKLKNELNNQIIKNENIEKELNNYKEINNKILEENSNKQEQINEFKNNYIRTDESNKLLQQIEQLNKVIEEKEQEIEELKDEITKIKNKQVNGSLFSGYNKKESSFGGDLGFSSKGDRFSLGGDIINDAEKIEKLIERVKEYKNQIDMNNELIKILKEEIKSLKQKLTNFETFGGKISNYNEFIRIFNIALKDYKP